MVKGAPGRVQASAVICVHARERSSAQRHGQGAASRIEEEIHELTMVNGSPHSASGSPSNARRIELRASDIRSYPNGIRLWVFLRLRQDGDGQPQPVCDLSGVAVADVRGDVEDYARSGSPVRLHRSVF